MSEDLAPGLYEDVVTAALAGRLASIEDALVERIALRPAEAADRIAQHLAREVVRAIDAVPEAERNGTGIEVARLLIDQIAQRLPRSGAEAATPADPAAVLTAIGEWRPDGTVRMPDRPMIPLLDTTLLTNAPGEPRLGSQILAEIASADSIDLVMAFLVISAVLTGQSQSEVARTCGVSQGWISKLMAHPQDGSAARPSGQPAWRSASAT